MNKSEDWKQNNPIDQLTAILGNLEGNLSNLEDGTITKELFAEYVDSTIHEIKALKPFLQEPEKWNNN